MDGGIRPTIPKLSIFLPTDFVVRLATFTHKSVKIPLKTQVYKQEASKVQQLYFKLTQ